MRTPEKCISMAFQEFCIAGEGAALRLELTSSFTRWVGGFLRWGCFADLAKIVLSVSRVTCHTRQHTLSMKQQYYDSSIKLFTHPKIDQTGLCEPSINKSI